MSIPKDIMAMAERLHAVAHRNHKEDTILIIAHNLQKAILAERAACAQVARGLNGWGPVGGNLVAEHIAKVIEART